MSRINGEKARAAIQRRNRTAMRLKTRAHLAALKAAPPAPKVEKPAPKPKPVAAPKPEPAATAPVAEAPAAAPKPKWNKRTQQGVRPK